MDWVDSIGYAIGACFLALFFGAIAMALIVAILGMAVGAVLQPLTVGLPIVLFSVLVVLIKTATTRG